MAVKRISTKNSPRGLRSLPQTRSSEGSSAGAARARERGPIPDGPTAAKRPPRRCRPRSAARSRHRRPCARLPIPGTAPAAARGTAGRPKNGLERGPSLADASLRPFLTAVKAPKRPGSQGTGPRVTGRAALHFCPNWTLRIMSLHLLESAAGKIGPARLPIARGDMASLRHAPAEASAQPDLGGIRWIEQDHSPRPLCPLAIALRPLDHAGCWKPFTADGRPSMRLGPWGATMRRSELSHNAARTWPRSGPSGRTCRSGAADRVSCKGRRVRRAGHHRDHARHARHGAPGAGSRRGLRRPSPTST